MKNKLKIIEKICIAGILISILIIVGGICYLWMNPGKDDKTIPEAETSKKELTGELDFMPSNLHLGEKIELDYFQDVQGNQISLEKEYDDKIKILIFWGSWCSYCDKTLQSLRECRKILKDYEDIEIILINKTDTDKEETVEKAKNYLDEQDLDFSCFYDKDLMGYNAYGIKRIPTILVLDKHGYVRDIKVSTIESEQEWRQLFDEAEYGKDYRILKKIESEWMGKEGQIYTEKKQNQSSSPSGHDVLSESQGIMMEYAVISDNKELFEKSENFLQNNLEREHIYSWYFTEDGKQAEANALLDDLRIYKAFSLANDLWGEQEKQINSLLEGIWEHNTDGNELYSFYDFSQKKPGKEIALNYVDFKTFELLAKQDEKFGVISQNMKSIVENGYISDTFPLYYSSYDYKKKKYSEENLHTAEALFTLYHLAQVERMKNTSREWLREQLAENGLYARYGTDGDVADGYEYESVAVYAIAALTGIELQDSDIYTKAIQRMEVLMQQNTETDNMRVFDLLMPMLAYARGNEVEFY